MLFYKYFDVYVNKHLKTIADYRIDIKNDYICND